MLFTGQNGKQYNYSNSKLYYEKGKDVSDNYSSTLKQAEEFNKAVTEYYQAKQAADDAISRASTLGIDTSEIERYAEYLQQTEKEFKDNEQAAREYAAKVMEMNLGIKELADSYDDVSDALKNYKDHTQESFQALDTVSKSLSKIFNTDISASESVSYTHLTLPTILRV